MARGDSVGIWPLALFALAAVAVATWLYRETLYGTLFERVIGVEHRLDLIVESGGSVQTDHFIIGF